MSFIFGGLPANYDAIIGLIVKMDIASTAMFEINSCIRGYHAYDLDSHCQQTPQLHLGDEQCRKFGEELNLPSFKLVAKSPNLSPRQIFPLYSMFLNTLYYIQSHILLVRIYSPSASVYIVVSVACCGAIHKYSHHNATNLRN